MTEHLEIMLAAEDAASIAPKQRVTCKEHLCWNDVVHNEREHQ
jgi:hypothetical protein